MVFQITLSDAEAAMVRRAATDAKLTGKSTSAPRRSCDALRAPPPRSAGSGGGPSLEDLIRPRQQRGRDREAERLGGLEVDDEFKLGRLFDGKVRRLCAFQNL